MKSENLSLCVCLSVCLPLTLSLSQSSILSVCLSLPFSLSFSLSLSLFISLSRSYIFNCITFSHFQLAIFGSRSQGDPHDIESDQSILDDHVSRIFNQTGAETPPSVAANFGRYNRMTNVTANATSLFDTSRRSDNNVSAISGHSTLPGRSKAAAYNHYGE